MRVYRKLVMYESVGEYLKNGGDEKLLIRWRDIPKKENLHGRDVRPQATLGSINEFPREMQMRIYRIARKFKFRISKHENTLTIQDLDFLELPGKWLITEDGMVLKILRLYVDRKKKYVMIDTGFKPARLTSTARCMFRHFHEPDSMRRDILTTQKIAFFMYFFITGDLLKSMAMTYRHDYVRLRSLKGRIGYIFRHIVNPNTIIRMKMLLDEEEYKKLLEDTGASAKDALQSLAAMTKDRDVDGDTRLDAIKTQLRINGINPDEVKFEKAQQNNFFGSLPSSVSPALPALPVKQITGIDTQDAEVVKTTKIKIKKGK